MSLSLESLTYLFDAAPSLDRAERAERDDRVVAVWGASEPAVVGRDQQRMRGFLPDPQRWSGAKRDRGHLVAHAAGGGLDLNLMPQSAALNRGHSPAGRRWRAMERHAAEHAGTPLFVRPLYGNDSWEPSEFEFALLLGQTLKWERFSNSP